MADNKLEDYETEYLARNRPTINTGLNTVPPDLSTLDTAMNRLTVTVRASSAVDIAKALAQWVRQNSKMLSIITCVLVLLMFVGLALFLIASVLALLMCVGLTILVGIGFGPVGIVAGVIAAATQAIIGSVTAGSFLAILMSAAMSGLPIVVGIVWGMAHGVIWGLKIGVSLGLVIWREWAKGADGRDRRSEHGGSGGGDNDDTNGFQRVPVRQGREGNGGKR